MALRTSPSRTTNRPPAPRHSEGEHRHAALLPIGAMLLAGSMQAAAQQAAGAKVLPTVTVLEKAVEPEGKDTIQATTTRIGKGQQALRDIPQSVTVVTEKLIDDRNLDTLKDVLHNTAGITFLAAEGGEEDIRLRGFSLAGTGDIFVDGMRDPAFYERDTFANDRIEVLRGSASMLFGRGSTGGAVNQVSKTGRTIDRHEISTTLGSHDYRRITGDFNLHTGENAGLRINAMATTADNNGAGASIDKRGLAANYRWGIGTADEFSASLYHLDNRNGINYGLPWVRPGAGEPVSKTSINTRLDPTAYYGLASDRNDGTATYATFSHTHRFQDDGELRTQIRRGSYARDQRSGAIRFAGTNPSANNPLANPATVTADNLSDATVLNRGTHNKIQDFDSLYVQSDLSRKFDAYGLRHELTAGVDIARERKTVFAPLSAAQGGVDITKPQTTVGSPNDGAWVDEGQRVLGVNNRFQSTGWGVYLQDLVQIAPHWKLLGGLRYDHMKGEYDNFNLNTGGVTSYQQSISDWSQRAGVLYQPTDRHSFHLSYGTSFNTSGDTYSYNALSANTPPEASVNVELGAKIDSADKRFSTRLALFRSTKTNERNTDPDNAATALLLSGKRHTSGLEIDLSGRLTDRWEVYVSYVWQPVANIDVAAPTAGSGESQGERPWLTPKHSGTIWTTYQVTPQLRLGGGINFRSSQTPNRNPGWSAPGYATVDLMAEYLINERLTLKANLSNVGDKLYADALYSGHYVPGAGRNLQVTLNAQF
ncbi:MAG: TonB-dependent siderophore receptor [Burkholderiaceae bacterium]